MKPNDAQPRGGGKEATMDKEMMDKVNEILKKNGKRELSLDELDKVVGGETSAAMNSLLDDPEAVRSFVYDVIAPIDAVYGKDIVVTLLDEMFHNPELIDEYKGSGLAGLHNYLGQKCVQHAYTDSSWNPFH